MLRRGIRLFVSVCMCMRVYACVYARYLSYELGEVKPLYKCISTVDVRQDFLIDSDL